MWNILHGVCLYVSRNFRRLKSTGQYGPAGYHGNYFCRNEPITEIKC